MAFQGHLFSKIHAMGLCVCSKGKFGIGQWDDYWRGSGLYAPYTLRPHTVRQYEFFSLQITELHQHMKLNNAQCLFAIICVQVVPESQLIDSCVFMYLYDCEC